MILKTLLYGLILFQFYDSPIKSVMKLIPHNGKPLFQFYDSPIKRCATFNFTI